MWCMVTDRCQHIRRPCFIHIKGRRWGLQVKAKHTKKVYGGVEVKFNSLWTSALDGNKWSALQPVHFTSGKECSLPQHLDWVFECSCRGVKISCLCQEFNSGLSSLYSSCYTVCADPVFFGGSRFLYCWHLCNILDYVTSQKIAMFPATNDVLASC
jgi:hypothetical protein